MDMTTLFAGASLDGYEDLYQSVLEGRQRAFDQAVAHDRIQPFLYPWNSIAASVLFMSILLIPRIPATYRLLASLGSFGVICYLCIEILVSKRTLGFAGGYGIGLMCAWGMIMSLNLLFIRDVRTEVKRLEWRSVNQQDVQPNEQVLANGPRDEAESTSKVVVDRRIWGVNGPASERPSTDRHHNGDIRYQLVWQGYPSGLYHCTWWTADLITTFRGAGWDFRIPTLPPFDVPLPKAGIKGRSPSVSAVSKSTSLSKTTLHTLHRSAVRDCVMHYMLLDFMKTTVISDPYFLGLATLDSPSPWLLLCNSPFLSKFVRLLTSMMGVIAVLTYVFSLSPVFFALVLPSIIDVRKFTYVPILEPSLYPPYWGQFATSLLDKGLAGFWGKWWHQMFRFGISEPSRYLIEQLHLNPRGQVARVVQVLIAFTLTGFIHGAASHTAFQPSNPQYPFLFFFVQGIGILIQSALVNAYSKRMKGKEDKLPRWLTRASNAAFVLIWLWVTGPLLVDDFASSGVWLLEPVPISPIRGLLYGKWWVWTTHWTRFWKGDTIWESGIALLA